MRERLLPSSKPPTLFGNSNFQTKKKKILLFPEMHMTRKIITGVAANLFFNRFFGYILFSSFLLFIFFFCFFVCFLKLKLYILIQIRLCGRVSDKKFSLGRFPETKLLSFCLKSVSSITMSLQLLCENKSGASTENNGKN